MKRSSSDLQSLRAMLGLFVVALQILGALHFTLVRHGYSAALGGVVHVHASSAAEQARHKSAGPRTTAVASDVPGCATERCPDANAPHGSAPQIELLFAGSIAFGQARLLAESSAYSSESLRVFLSAPKTSPPA